MPLHVQKYNLTHYSKMTLHQHSREPNFNKNTLKRQLMTMMKRQLMQVERTPACNAPAWTNKNSSTGVHRHSHYRITER